MAEVVSLESRRKPVRYVVEIDRFSNGKVSVFIPGLDDDVRARLDISTVLRHAADIIIDASPESRS